MNNEIKKAAEIGRKGTGKYVWHLCTKCSKGRWVKLYKGKPRNIVCRQCNARGEGNPNWRGKGRHDDKGYIRIYIRRDSFFYPMACKTTKGSYITGHRLAIAGYLGRNLHPWEIVHHKNGIKDDNRIENLQLTSYDKHNGLTILDREIKRLKAMNRKLKEENKWLKKQRACVTG